MAVNSFREDEQVQSMGKWKVVVRLLSYLRDHIAGDQGGAENQGAVGHPAQNAAGKA